MKNRIGFLALLLPVLAITTLTVAGEGKPFRVPFRDVHGLIFIDVKVNGKPAVMLCDTGADITLFQGVPYSGRKIQLEIGGQVFMTKTYGVGHLGFTDAGITRILNVNGILGENFLREFSSVRIDYKNQIVEFEP